MTLSGEADQPLVKPPTDDIDAYELYLKGRYMWNKRTKDGMLTAVDYFNQAIERDSKYAPAYSGLADAYLVLGSYAHMPRPEARQRAREAAERAIALDETLAEAHTSRGQVYRLEWNWRGEEQEYRRAIALKPNYATAHQWYSTLLAALGRLDEALVESRRAEELDPMSPAIAVTVGIHLASRREYDAAEKQLNKTLELDPDFVTAHAWLATVYENTQRSRESLAKTDKLLELRPDHPDIKPLVASAYARAGEREKALLLMQESNDPDPAVVGVFHTGMGDTDLAFEWLNQGVDVKSWVLVQIKSHTWFDSLRSDPRYDALLERMGLL